MLIHTHYYDNTRLYRRGLNKTRQCSGGDSSSYTRIIICNMWVIGATVRGARGHCLSRSRDVHHSGLAEVKETL